MGETCYYPFGETRLTTGSIYTDKLFTGQREVTGLGIYHYGARFYSPYITQFSQPDSIIPDLYNPQSLNRYAYTLNNPVRYTDPTGHEICMDDGNCKKTITAEMVAARYGVKFENGSKTWTTKDKLAVLRAITDVARKLSARTGDTAVNAFRDVFSTSSTPMVFLMGNTGSQFTNDGSGYYDDDNDPKTPEVERYCEIGSGGCNVGATSYKATGQSVNVIKFESLSSVFFRARNNVVHELGHAFYNAIGTPKLGNSFSRDALIRNQTVGGKEVLEWEQHPGACCSELFADTFLAWTYNAWNTDPLNVNAVRDARNAMNAISLP